MTEDLERRLDRLESLVDDQQETIREQRERIARLEREGGPDAGSSPPSEEFAVSRRTALQAGGLLALLGIGGGTASADPQGQVGTEGDPLGGLYTRQLTLADPPYDGTGDETVTDLTGAELALSGGTLGIGTDAVTSAAIDLSTLAGPGIVVDGSVLSIDDPPEPELTASDAQDFDNFGTAVGISDDGTTALVGAPLEDGSGTNRGKVYVYDLTTSPPTETELTASDAQDDDAFGSAVGISEDGTVALVGAPKEDDPGIDSGKAYVYDLTASNPDDPASETQLAASDA